MILDKDTNCNPSNILQDTYVISVYMTGSFMAFGIGIVYCFLHTVITRKMYPMYNSRSIWLVRLFISVFGLLSFILSRLIFFIHSIVVILTFLLHFLIGWWAFA